VVLAALRSRDFRLLWLGQSVSVIGDALLIVAVGLFVTRLTGDPWDVGLVLAAYSLPLVVFLLIGGVVADRLPRQWVMLVSDVVRGLAHALLAVLIATGTVRVAHLVVIGLVFATAQAFFQPAYAGLVPQTVAEADIQAAQALGGVSRELATFAGPALATALVLTSGGALAFAVDAATFAVSALTLWNVRTRSRGEPGERRAALAELREGWSAVRERAWVWAPIAANCAALLLALAPFFVLGPAVSRREYGTEAVYGIVNAAWGVGTISGALAAVRWRPRRPLLATVLAGTLWPGQIALFATGADLRLLFPSTVLCGAGIGLYGVWWETALAQRIPPHLLSRVSAWDWMGSLALLPLGYLISGPLARGVGETPVLVTGGLLGMAAMAATLLVRSLRELARVEQPA